MKIFRVIVIILILILAILFTIPIKITAEFEKDENAHKTRIFIKYGIFKIDKFKKRKTKKEKPKEPKKKPLTFKEKKEKIEKYARIFESIKDDIAAILKRTTEKGLVFEQVTLKSDFGFDDAMNTGIFTGIYNAFVYSILGVIHHNSTLKNMEISLSPVFEKPCFNIKAGCILRIKTVHIIFVVIKVLKIIIKIKKIEGRK